VFLEQHRRPRKTIRARFAVTLAAFLVSLSGACADEPALVSPRDPLAIVSSRASTDRTSSSGDADDVLDAIDRIAPVLGESSAANAVRGALKDLLEDIPRNNVNGTQRDAAALSQALDRLASLGDPGLGAEIDAIRFVADARK
jgi:hypothetical protein